MMSDEVLQRDVEACLESLAERVHDLGLSMPALALLEMHRPLRGLAHAGALVLEPSLRFLCGAGRSSMLVSVLESPEAIDRLITLLEHKASSRKQVGSCEEGTHGRI